MKAKLKDLYWLAINLGLLIAIFWMNTGCRTTCFNCQ